MGDLVAPLRAPFSATALPRVAILGTGKMGAAIARCLAGQGVPLTLWNRTRSRADSLRIGVVADSPAQAVEFADVVITSMTGPAAISETLLGPGGALAAARGQLFVEMSTVGPDVVLELGVRVGECGSRLVDAPILAPPATVERGRAAMIVGGDDEDLVRARPILDLLGSVRHVGPLGSAARLKLVSNAMLGAIVSSAAELQVAGEALDLAPDDVFFVLARLAPALEPRRAGYTGVGGAVMFALRDLRKDLDLALELFRGPAYVPITALVGELVRTAAAGHPDEEVSSVIAHYRSTAARGAGRQAGAANAVDFSGTEGGAGPSPEAEPAT